MHSFWQPVSKMHLILQKLANPVIPRNAVTRNPSFFYFETEEGFLTR